MLSRLRAAAMWLLLFALPLQGFAVATMVGCGPGHERMIAASMADPADSHDHAMADDEAAPDGDIAAPPAHADHLGHLDKVAKLKCSACAACCLGAALPTAPFSIACVPAATAPAVSVAGPHVDFVSAALDRPPRPHRG